MTGCWIYKEAFAGLGNLGCILKDSQSLGKKTNSDSAYDRRFNMKHLILKAGTLMSVYNGDSEILNFDFIFSISLPLLAKSCMISSQCTFLFTSLFLFPFHSNVAFSPWIFNFNIIVSFLLDPLSNMFGHSLLFHVPSIKF